MKIKSCFLFLFLLTSYTGFSQRVSYTVIDSLTKDPIPYVNIILKSKSGTVSNEKGKFSLSETKNLENEKIKISCLGYKTKMVLLKEVTNKKILLSPESIYLSSVTVSNVSLDVADIIDKAIEHIEDNYAQQYVNSKFFLRQTLSENITRVKTEKLKSNIEQLTQEKLDSLTNEIPKTITKYTEILFDYNEQPEIGSDFKLNPLRIVKHEEKDQASALDSIKIYLISLLKKHLPESTQIRFKSGLFKLGNDVNLDDAEQPQPYDKKNKDDKTITKSKYIGLNFVKELLYKNPKQFDFFRKPKYYEFDLKGEINYGKSSVYVISIIPKSNKAKYEGQIFIDTQDFGIHKLDVKTIEGISEKMFGLFGIRSIMNGRSYRIFFQKTSDLQSYFPKYVRVETREDLSIDRNIQIKSLSKNGKEKLVSFKADINIVDHYIEEASFDLINIIKKEKYENINTEKSTTEVIYPEEYSFNIWKNYGIIEPEKILLKFKKK